MWTWEENRLDYYESLRDLGAQAAESGPVRISAMGMDPGDKETQGHSGSLALVSATVRGTIPLKRALSPKMPRKILPEVVTVSDIEVVWAKGVPWRTGVLSRLVYETAPRVNALVCEGQFWPHVNQYQAGGIFKSLSALAGCSGAAAGAAHAAGLLHVFQAQPTSWFSLLGKHAKSKHREISLDLVTALGRPVLRDARDARTSDHDLAAAVCLGLLGLGLANLSLQVIDLPPALSKWISSREG